MKKYRHFVLIAIAFVVFLLSGCVGKYIKPWGTDKIRTAILAARVIETTADIRYDIEGSESKPYTQNGLALMLNDGLLLTLKHIVDVPKVERGSMFGRPYEIPLLATNLKHYLDDEEIDLIGTFDDIAVFDTHKGTGQLIKFGNSDTVNIGDEVLLIGRSLGVDLNVKAGVVSNTVVSPGHGGDESDLSNCFLLAIPTNYGDSGGMVFNRDFELIGIANAMAMGEGMGFAIKINEVKNYIQTILFGCGIGVVPY